MVNFNQHKSLIAPTRFFKYEATQDFTSLN